MKTAATVFWLALALLVGTMVVLMALVATGATVSIT